MNDPLADTSHSMLDVHVYENVLRVRAYRLIREIEIVINLNTYKQHVNMTHAPVYVFFMHENSF